MFKVGDIIHHSNLGLMVITKDFDTVESKSFSIKIHNRKLFRMNRLVSDLENDYSYILYENSINKARLATDEDIINTLTNVISTIEVTPTLKVYFDEKDTTVSIYDNSVDNFISLSHNELRRLKQVLEEIV